MPPCSSRLTNSMMIKENRRYDIDALRVIAIGLLLLYHTAIGFQAWGFMIGFITHKTPMPSLWPAMAMLNVWRIPLLFFVSGMGVYFAIQNRNRKQLLLERSKRILLPFVFGALIIVPIHMYILQRYYSLQTSYEPSPGHLWFLGNIFLYVLMLFPVFYYLKQHENGRIGLAIKKLFSTPLGLLVVVLVFMLETVWVDPGIFELYAMTWHGFFLGLIAFFFGFCFVFSGQAFLTMLVKWKWLLLSIAVLLYVNRFLAPQMRVDSLFLVLESNCWIFTLFAFANQYLNRDSKALRYLTQAAYPVYIVHMIMIYLISSLVFPLNLDVTVKFVIVLIGTFGGSLILYEFLIRRLKFIRPFFGLNPYFKNKSKSKTQEEGISVS